MQQEQPVIIIAGPTAAGKTGAAVRLCQEISGEVISADAMAVYRYMDVGTAKPTVQERAAVPHHLVDVADPDEDFDAARYSRMAREAATGILARGKLPVVAGGTGLYIKTMLHGLFSRGESDPKVRDALRREAEERGPAALHERLAGLDPVAAARIHPNDAFRIVRALQIIETTGKPITAQQKDHGFAETPYRPLYLFLCPDRDVLYRRISERVDRMMEAGFLAEVEGLLSRGYGRDLKAMQSIGYRQLAAHLAGETSLEDAVMLIKRDTRRFAKRQITWFSAAPEAVRADPGDHERIRELAREHLGA
ncbi:MAG: tRNA (adenosine(37)-N6)-dimethylallyltransferase MiaA [Thermodesulfobacteriota bacterium]